MIDNVAIQQQKMLRREIAEGIKAHVESGKIIEVIPPELSGLESYLLYPEQHEKDSERQARS